jgi:hypothetical protein
MHTRYLLIYEDGDITTTWSLTSDHIEQNDHGTLEIINITDPRRPERMSAAFNESQWVDVDHE